MRISQLKSVCWVANCAALCGAGFVGVHFWKTFKARAQRPEVTWPKAEKAELITTRWPGALPGFEPIWKTPVNGVVPPPPPPPAPREKEKPDAKFRATYSCEGGIEVDGDPTLSLAIIKSGGGTPTMVQPGERLSVDVDGQRHEFTLLGFGEDPKSHQPAIVFSCPALTELLYLPRKVPAPVNLGAGRPPVDPLPPGGRPFERAVERARISGALAYRDTLADPTGNTWRVPADEAAWWEQFGDEEVLAKLVTETVQGPDGPRGVKLLSVPGANTPVAAGRGIGKGDTVVSINGVAVRAKEDILRYLRGDGRGLARYDVLVIDETGRERTVVYLTSRPRAAE